MSVAAIIPAYNEEGRIGNVIVAVEQVPEVDSIIVVSDGSTDATVAEAASAGKKVKVVELLTNQGKGAAMLAGVHATDADILLFLDADLVGLRPDHVRDLLLPVLSGDFDMAMAVFMDGRFATDLAQKIAPFLSGQRALTRNLLERVPRLQVSRFGVEMALTQFIGEEDIPFARVPWHGITHVMKEEKLGLAKGFCARIKMYWEILRSLKLVRGR
ncbi:MAG: glycosyltransferase family 2 protein [Firmicutes bacterium]|jgi:glycosyltransferase involved in cell wall biosynthesis|nr:glycosyltransferase family 2 protein [Bacillota bacterium]